MERLDTLQSIELAEGVGIRLRIAGPFLRGMAWGIDFLIKVLLLVMVSMFIGVIGIAVGSEIAEGVFFLILFVGYWGYNVAFEISPWSGTPGKRIFGLQVVQASGAPVTLYQSMIRNLVRIADILPGFYLAGIVATLLTARFQRLGDLAADTVVAYRERPVAAGPPPLRTRTEMPPIALSREEQAAFVEFQERVGNWSDARKEEIAGHLEPLSGRQGRAGVDYTLAVANWLQES